MNVRSCQYLSRSLLLAAALAFSAGLTHSAAAQQGIYPLRIMAANLTTGSGQTKWQDPGVRIAQGLDADVTLIQEFNVGSNTKSELDNFVKTAFGSGYSYFRETGGNMPNGIVSRYPIITAGEWDDKLTTTRDFAWAQIDIPGYRDLWVVSVHFMANSATARATQATDLVAAIKAKTIPPDDFLVIGGSLNTTTRTENAIKILSSAVGTAAPYPADAASDSDTNQDRTKPLDWLLVNANLASWGSGISMDSGYFPNGLVFDSRVYTPLSDATPVVSTDSSGMQHMAVLRGFMLYDDEYEGNYGKTLKFTEFMYRPLNGPEWLEIFNYGVDPVDMTGMVLINVGPSGEEETWMYFPDGLTVWAGTYLVVGSYPDTIVDVAWSGTGMTLWDEGDRLKIVNDPERDLIYGSEDISDDTNFKASWGGNGNGKTLNRTCLHCDSNIQSTWAQSKSMGGTPGWNPTAWE